MPRAPIPPSEQTIAGLHGYGLTFAGICSRGHPARQVQADMPALRGDVLGVDIAKRITCSACEQRVAVTVADSAPLERQHW